MSAPYKAMDIVNAFINLALKNKKPLSQLPLLKLIYIAHAFSLAMYDKPLIQEQFSAWKYGPVIPEVYNELKGFGSNNITSIIGEYNCSQLKNNQLINIIYKIFAKKAPFQLVDITHNPGGAWDRAFHHKEFSYLTNIDIKNEYKALLKLS